MLLKRKSIFVIFLSSVVLSFIILTTVTGFYFYTTWKEKENEGIYFEKLATVLAKFYSRYLNVEPLGCSISKFHPYKDKPVLIGNLENRGSETVRHLVLKVTFLNFKNKAIYNLEFRPLRYVSKKENIRIPFIEILLREDEVPLGPMEKLEFTFSLENCPKDIIDLIVNEKPRPKRRIKSSKTSISEEAWSGELDYKIIGVTFTR